MIIEERNALEADPGQVAAQVSREQSLILLSEVSAAESFTNSAFPVIHRSFGEGYLKVLDTRFQLCHSFSEIVGAELAEQAGVRVAHSCVRYVTTFAGEEIATIYTSKVPGKSLVESPELLTKSHVDTVLDAISRLHNRSSRTYGSVTRLDYSYKRTSSYAEFVSDIMDLALKKATKRGIHFEKITAIARLHERASFAAREVDVFVLSHKDLNLKHLFFEDSNTLHIIDWEWSLFLDAAYDYGVFLASLLTDHVEADTFDYAMDATLGGSRISPALLYFHLGREMFFSAVYRHRSSSSPPEDRAASIDRSIEYLTKSVDLQLAAENSRSAYAPRNIFDADKGPHTPIADGWTTKEMTRKRYRLCSRRGVA